MTQADIARIVRGMRDAGVRNVCTVIRQDGVYVEADERDRVPVVRVPEEPVAEPERFVPL